MREFLWGALAALSAVAGLLFLRFYRDLRDRLFLFFGLGFWTLGLNWSGLALGGGDDEARRWYFWIRLAAFLLFIVGVVDKNREAR